MRGLFFRKAALSDAPSIADIHTRSWSAAYKGLIDEAVIAQKNAARQEQWPRLLNGAHDVYLALVDGAPVGFFTAQPCRDEDLTGAGEIGAMYLDPDHFRRGYGRAMMERALELLREEKYATVALWVLERNDNARRFYEACGFAPDGAIKESGLGGDTMIVRYTARLSDAT